MAIKAYKATSAKTWLIQAHLNLKAMIGTEVTIGITLDGVLAVIEGLAELGLSNGERDDDCQDLTGGGIRYLSGMVSRIEQVGIRNRHTLYKLTLAPSLWLLTKTTDYKIFQNKSVIHIIDEVLAGYTFAVETRYNQECPHLDFAVQYGQTDFDFISQLMVEYGMVKRLIRTVKEQCLWLHNFELVSAARVALKRWFQFYNHERPHQALKMKTPAEVYALAA